MKWKENEMKPENKKILHKAIATFGRYNQCLQTVEELMELQKAVFENAHRGTDNRQNIVEEVADVEIMIAQLKMIYDIKSNDIEEIQDYKIGRLNKTVDKYIAKKEAEKKEQIQENNKHLQIDRVISSGKDYE